MLNRQPCITKETFNGSLVMSRLFDLYLLYPHLILRLDIVPLPTHSPLIMLTFKPPLGPLERNKCLFEPMLHLRTPLFVALFKSSTMSFVGCLLLRPNTFKIGISLMVNHPTLLPHLPSDCFLLLPFSLLLCSHIEDNVLFKYGGVNQLFDAV